MKIKNLKIIILILFFLSGATGLIFEVIWTRMFTVVFGNTVFATSTVLSAFMAGLALGSYFFGKIIDHQKNVLKFYAALEGGIGILALIFPLALAGLNHFYTWIFQNIGYNFYFFNLLKFFMSFLLLIIPASLMGGTLPVLSKFFVMKEKTLGRTVGDLYSVNTFGAVTGTFLAGFFMVQILGVTHSIYIAAFVNILISILVFGISYFSKLSLSTDELKAEKKPRSSKIIIAQDKILRLSLAGFFISGFAALAYEVLWSRVLVYLFSTSTYAFSIMLISFLIGIALGSFIFARFVDKIKDLILSFGIIEIGIGFYGIISVVLLGNSININRFLEKLFRIESWWNWNIIRFTEAFLIMLLPTILMGATFPIIIKIFSRSVKNIGSNIGLLYSFNTVGGVFGSFVAGFVLIAFIGAQTSIYLIALLNILLGITFLSFSSTIKKVHKIIFSGILICTFVFLTLVVIPKRIFYDAYNIIERGSKIIFCNEGVTATVTVHQYPDFKVISVNGINVAGTDFMLRTTQNLQGHIPLLLHPNPKQVLQVGFGTGETSRAVLTYDVAQLDAVELCSDVMKANEHFREINDNVYQKPRFNPIIMDGKNYVQLTNKKYDVIMNDSIHPNAMSNSSLYSYDYFINCREKLNDNGIMSSWFPLFGLKDEDFRTLIKSFVTAFPHSTLWIGNNCLNRHAQLVGWKSKERFKIDYEVLNQRLALPETKRDLQMINVNNVYDFLDFLVADEVALQEFTKNATINDDENPTLEFSAPKTLGDDYQIWATNLKNVLEHRSFVYNSLKNIPPDDDTTLVRAKFQTYFNASTHLWKGQIWELQQNSLQAQREYYAAQKLNPDDSDAQYLLSSLSTRASGYMNEISYDQNNIDVYNKLGLFYMSEGKLDSAIIIFNEALKLDKNNSVVSSNLGMAFLYKKEFDKSIEFLSKAISLNSKNVEAVYNLGLVYAIGKKDMNKAIVQWEKTIAIDPQYTSALFNLGLAYFNKREYKESIKYLQNTIAIQPQNVKAKRLLETAINKSKAN